MRIRKEYEEERNLTFVDEQNQGSKEIGDEVTNDNDNIVKKFDQISDSDKIFEHNTNKKHFANKERVKIVLNGEENELEDFIEKTKYDPERNQEICKLTESNQILDFLDFINIG